MAGGCRHRCAQCFAQSRQQVRLQDALWNARPVDTHPMSVAAHQSAPLLDEEALRERARELGRDGVALPRPERWVGYLLEPASVEFWQSEPEDRLHRRLRYEREGPGWHTCRLQP